MRTCQQAVVLLLLPLLSGCGDSLSNEDAAALLLKAWRSAACPPNSTPDNKGFSFGQSFRGPINLNAGVGYRSFDKIMALDRWFRQTIENDHATYTLVSQRRIPCPAVDCGDEATYQYDLDGTPMTVMYAKGDYFTTQWQSFYRNTRAQISLCTSIPDAVQVLDITVDPETRKTATVTYTMTWRFTPLGSKLNEAGIFDPFAVGPRGGSFPPMGGQEVPNKRAVFQRLDATGWQVAGLSE